MQKKEATNKQVWNDFVQKYGPRSGAFLHAWEWSEIAHGERYEFTEDNELVGLVSTGFIFLPFRQTYVSCIRGPVSCRSEKILDILKLLVGYNSVFVRFEPREEIKNFRIKKTLAITPPNTLITSLLPSVQDLLAKMHPKTRYNILLANRRGVEVRFLKAEDLDKVWPLFQETAKRDGFRIHPKEHYQNLLNLTGENLKVFLVAAYFEDQPIAANIMVDFNETRTYLHGASASENRNVMAPHLLHWELMKEAKEKALKFYDWWGIAPNENPKDPWAGITRFKKGFGGEVVSYPGTFDYVVKPCRYYLYLFGRFIMRKIR